MVNKYFHKNIPSHPEPSSFLDIPSISWRGKGMQRGWLEPNRASYPYEVKDHCGLDG